MASFERIEEKSVILVVDHELPAIRVIGEPGRLARIFERALGLHA